MPLTIVRAFIFFEDFLILGLVVWFGSLPLRPLLRGWVVGVFFCVLFFGFHACFEGLCGVGIFFEKRCAGVWWRGSEVATFAAPKREGFDLARFFSVFFWFGPSGGAMFVAPVRSRSHCQMCGVFWGNLVPRDSKSSLTRLGERQL